MKFRLTLYITAVIAALIVVAGCRKGVDTRLPVQSSDTLYTEERAMVIYANDKHRALQIIDSAQQVGNLTAERADLRRATVYCRTLDMPNHDSAIVIAERLLATKTANADPTFRESVLEVLVYSTRQLEDYELQINYSTQLADAYRKQDNRVEALRTEAEVGAALCRLGRTDEGLAKMDSVISMLTLVRQFNELDAGIIAMKRKISVMRDYPEIAATAHQLLDRIEDYEQHPADFHDGSPREPADGERPGYIAFYRSQAWIYLAAAYAHMNVPQKARQYLARAAQSDFGQTLSGKKMMAPTLCLLGEYARMEAIYSELTTVFMERGDTLTLDYAQLLLDRAKAAEAQGRYSESLDLWEQHALTLQKAEERLLRSKANLYAARYLAQQQQMAIDRQQAELERRNIINIVLSIGLVGLLAVVLYVLRQQRILRQKNSVLAREIYKGVKETNKKPTPTPSQREGSLDSSATPSALDGNQSPLPKGGGGGGLSVGGPAISDSSTLFQHIRHVILRDELYLDPTLNRQKLIDLFSLSKEQLGAAFSKGSTYNSVTDFINDCRLPYAAKLLVERPDLSIAEVAEASGFARAATFTANFKKKFALTPNQYREQAG